MSGKRWQELAARLRGRRSIARLAGSAFATLILGSTSTSTIVPLTPHQRAGSLTAEDWESVALPAG